MKTICAIDLFCGAGALTYGLAKAGIDVKVGFDNDPSCEYAYDFNNQAKFILESVAELDGNSLVNYFENNSIKLLAGCAPCQTFSSYNRKASSTDSRWWLLAEFSRLVRELLPELVTMENVPGLKEKHVFEEFVENLEALGYDVSSEIVDCFEYGVSQHRKRLVLLASRLGPIELLQPSKFRNKRKTVRDVIGKMPVLKAGQKDSKDPLHQCSALSKLNLKRIRASRPGGTWRDWRKDLVADCHKKDSGKTYPGVYGRMSWEQPAPTITTQYFGFGNGRFGHPDQDRAISLREGAMLQGFPKKYRFVQNDGQISKTQIGRLVGNAVPVRLGEIVGRSLINHVRGINGK